MDPREVVNALRRGEHVTIEKPTVLDVAPVLQSYYDLPTTGAGGAVHIIIEDGNIKRSFADWCLEWALTPNGYHDSDADVFMAWLLTQCSSTQRGKLDNERYGDPRSDPAAMQQRFWASADAFMEGRDVPTAVMP